MSEPFDSRNDPLPVLEAEVERLRAQVEAGKQSYEQLAEEYKLNVQEAQTARLALDVADKEVAALRAKLKWFEDREPLVRALCGQDAPAVAEYELLNPKPGAAT